VRPPDAPGWERSAAAWLFDLCPPDYRGYAVLTRRPVVLAWVASQHVEAAAQGARLALSRVRARWSAGAPQDGPVDDVVELLEAELARLLAAGRAVALVEAALGGRRYVPRL
jgi:hypothetical protein